MVTTPWLVRTSGCGTSSALDRPVTTRAPEGATTELPPRERVAPFSSSSAVPLEPPIVMVRAVPAPLRTTGALSPIVMHAACRLLGGAPVDQFLPFDQSPPAGLFHATAQSGRAGTPAAVAGGAGHPSASSARAAQTFPKRTNADLTYHLSYLFRGEMLARTGSGAITRREASNRAGVTPTSYGPSTGQAGPWPALPIIRIFPPLDELLSTNTARLPMEEQAQS